MKRILFVLLMIVFFSNYAFGKVCKGTLIYAQGMQKTVTVDVPVYPLQPSLIKFYLMHKSIKYKDASGAKLKAKPKEIVEVQFEFEGELIRMVSKEIKKEKKMFLIVLIENEKLNLYRRIYATQGSTTIYNYFQKGNEPFFYPKQFFFKSQMAEYFSDCPKLVEKIKNGDYSEEECYDMAQYYIDNCGGKKNPFGSSLFK